MDYIKEAEEILRTYSDLEKAVNLILEDIKVINFDLTSVKTQQYEVQSKKNRVNGDDVLANMIFKKQCQERAYKSTKAKVKNIEKALENIEYDGQVQTEDKKLLQMFYVDKLGEELTSDRLNISRATFHRRKYVAIKRFARQFYGIAVE